MDNVSFQCLCIGRSVGNFSSGNFALRTEKREAHPFAGDELL